MCCEIITVQKPDSIGFVRQAVIQYLHTWRQLTIHFKTQLKVFYCNWAYFSMCSRLGGCIKVNKIRLKNTNQPIKPIYIFSIISMIEENEEHTSTAARGTVIYLTNQHDMHVIIRPEESKIIKCLTTLKQYNEIFLWNIPIWYSNWNIPMK